MKALKYIVIAASLLIGSLKAEAQQAPQFTQYMFNPLFLNPAYAGYKEQVYLQSYYRKQWAGVEGSPETFAIAGDGYIANNNLGVGGHIMVDRLGAQRTTGAYANAAYHLRVSSEGYVSFGLGAGLVNSILDGSMLNPTNPNDPVIVSGREQVFYPDLRAGLFYYNPDFFVGISADNLFSSSFKFENGAVLLQPETSLYFTMGTFIDVSYNLAIKPSLLYVDNFHGPSRLDLNAFFLVGEKLWLGTSHGEEFRSDLKRPTSIVGLIAFDITDRLRLGYAYDHNMTGFGVNAFSTHDISIGYLLPPNRVRVISPRYF